MADSLGLNVVQAAGHRIAQTLATNTSGIQGQNGGRAPRLQDDWQNSHMRELVTKLEPQIGCSTMQAIRRASDVQLGGAMSVSERSLVRMFNTGAPIDFPTIWKDVAGVTSKIIFPCAGCAPVCMVMD
mmetsp:Transcript_55502/g.180015  ORF Transcript_55502/g.180015 Transcript_55502/m.180015 type:complete len:128 (-) Transcript_55502:658-1041(-)